MNYKERYYKFHGLDKCHILYCKNCGKVATCLHHVKYRSQGGTNDPTNLIPLCDICHKFHHDNNNPTTEEIERLMLSELF